MNDWSDLCAMGVGVPAAGNQSDACNPRPLDAGVTTQSIEGKEEKGIRNHKTTVTTEIDKGRETDSSESYSTCHKSDRTEKVQSPESATVRACSYDTLNGAADDQSSASPRTYPLRPARDVVWYLESSGEGWDCQFCMHLLSRWEYAENSRRRFRWRCGMGHPVMEYGQGSERVLLAPESCSEWVRFVPGQSKRGIVKEDPRRSL